MAVSSRDLVFTIKLVSFDVVPSSRVRHGLRINERNQLAVAPVAGEKFDFFRPSRTYGDTVLVIE